MNEIEGQPLYRDKAQHIEPGTAESIPAAEDALSAAESVTVLSEQPLIDYCKRHKISVGEGSGDLGLQLLSSDNRILYQAANEREIEVVKALLQTPARVKLAERTEEVSKKKLSSKKQDEKEIQDESNAYTDSTEYLLENLDNLTNKVINVLAEVVLRNEDISNWISKTVNPEKQVKLLHNAFSIINNSFLFPNEKKEVSRIFLNKLLGEEENGELRLAKELYELADSEDSYLRELSLFPIKDWSLEDLETLEKETSKTVYSYALKVKKSHFINEFRRFNNENKEKSVYFIFDNLQVFRKFSREDWEKIITEPTTSALHSDLFIKKISEDKTLGLTENEFIDYIGNSNVICNLISYHEFDKYVLQELLKHIKTDEGYIRLINKVVEDSNTFVAPGHFFDLLIDLFDFSRLSQIQIAKELVSNFDKVQIFKNYHKIKPNPISDEEINEWAKSLEPYSVLLLNSIQLDSKDWDQRLKIAKSLANCGGTEEVIQAIDQFVTEADTYKRNDFLNMLAREGDLSIILKYIDQFDTSSWNSGQWIRLLNRARYHITGIEFSKMIPEEIKNMSQIKELVKECEINYKFLKTVSGKMWNAIERKPVEDGEGFLLVYESNLPPNDRRTAEETNIEAYPAIERDHNEMYRGYNRKFKTSTYKELGFKIVSAGPSFENVTEKRAKLTVPDVQVLNRRFEKLSFREVYGKLHPKKFNKLVLEDDQIPFGIDEENKEAMHDMQFHILPAIDFIVESPEEYVSFRNEWRQKTKRGLEILEENKDQLEEHVYKQFFYFLSYVADALSSQQKESAAKYRGFTLRDIPERLRYYSDHIKIRSMLNRVFEGNYLSPRKFKKEWLKIFGNY